MGTDLFSIKNYAANAVPFSASRLGTFFRMDLKQLKYFCAVVDHGSFRKAADALLVSPPASSIGEATDEFFIILIANCNRVAVLPMIGAFTDAIDAGKLVELHVPKVNWASTVALVFRDGETLSPDARLLRDAARAALTESST